MWKSLLPVVREVRSQVESASSRSALSVPPKTNEPAARLRQLGRSLELVCSMIETDSTTNGQPVVISHDRQTAADLITLLLTDADERASYKSFLRLTLPAVRHAFLPDRTTLQFVLERRWSQLSSGMLGQLLLNAAAIDHLAETVVTEKPSVWNEYFVTSSELPIAPPAQKPKRTAGRKKK